MADPDAGGAALVAQGLRAARGGTEVLRGLDLTVRTGERVALTGPSGSGKTVLLSLLAGLVPPDRGVVLLEGRPLVEHGPTLRQRLGVVFQGYGLVALLTAAENVELPLLAAGLEAGQARVRTSDALAQVGLADRAEHLVEELSGGQQQRTAVARALALRPVVLLADEPTAEQDVAHRAATLEAILGVATTGGAVVLATHDPVVAARCDRELHLEGGLLSEVPRHRAPLNVRNRA